MIEVRYKGRLGNNMFQYCLGRILAEDLGFELRADPIAEFPNTAQYVGGARHEGPEQILTGHRIDLAQILADRSPRKIVLDGWFQCHSYYRQHRDLIRHWLKFDPNIPLPKVRPGVIVHVRRTDYVLLGWALPFSYYETALNRLPIDGEVWIATDDKRDPFFRNFRRWKPKFSSGTAAEQILFMSRAPHLIMSQSTFSWWPTFLGSPQKVICPVTSFGIWARGGADDPDLIEADRFDCIGCHTPYQPSGIEARHFGPPSAGKRLALAVTRRIKRLLPQVEK